MSICQCFAPAAAANAKILILGSMPSVKSLEMQQYYAHPQNRFWPIMSALCHKSTVPDTYPGKIAMLREHQIALWDVIGLCEREGSLDSAIMNETPNSIPELLQHCPAIHTICFNGGKAFASYKKHFPSLLANPSLNHLALPSTSPANAKWRLPQLIAAWQNAILNDI